MLFTYSSRDLSKKPLRIDLFDFFKLENKIKICYNIKEYKIKKENKMNKLYNNLTIDNLVKTEWFNQFNENQKHRIIKGLNDNLDVSIYAKPDFDDRQMDILRLGLKANIDVSIYAKPEFDWLQMVEIREGLEKNLDVSVYAKVEISWREMEQIRKKLENEQNT